ncbi:MAG: M3 family oligoendopeptidase [Verrucomicrobiota bacterium]
MKIAPYQPREYVPAEIDLTETDQLAPLLDRLQADLDAATTPEELEAWLDAYGETRAALSQSKAIAYIERTCATDDPAKEAAYMKIVEKVDPWLKPRQFTILQKLAAHPQFDALDASYEVFRRSIKMAVRLFREKNVPRQTEEAKLNTEYDKIMGAMTVPFDGKEQTLFQLARVQEETDRARREEAWTKTAERRLRDRDRLEDIFDRLLELRHEMAREADFADYRDYAFAMYERFDYTPQDCLDFHQAIEEHIVPVTRELQRERAAGLGVDPLKPWDLAVDVDGRGPLRPFADADEMRDKCLAIFEKLDPRLAEYYRLLIDHECLDLANRKGKAPGGYQSTLAEARLPFIFMNAVGMQRDVETMVHESGHAFHAVAARGQRLQAYRGAPIEFCEVASMAMELLTAPHWDAFYQEDGAKRARAEHLRGIVKFFPWMATIDAFQHWLYTNPGHSRGERQEAWLGLMDRFGGLEDWSGHADARASLWQRQLHLFEVPFYYVEYGIAQLGALQVWRASRTDAKDALESYLQGLALGGSRPLPELFTAAGIQFDFTAPTIQPLMEEVRDELRALDA